MLTFGSPFMIIMYHFFFACICYYAHLYYVKNMSSYGFKVLYKRDGKGDYFKSGKACIA